MNAIDIRVLYQIIPAANLAPYCTEYRKPPVLKYFALCSINIIPLPITYHILHISPPDPDSRLDPEGRGIWVGGQYQYFCFRWPKKRRKDPAEQLQYALQSVSQ
jgi:hypothetical protein